MTETKVETKPPVEAPKPTGVENVRQMPQKPPSVHDIERAKSIQILPQLLGIMQNFGVAEIEGLGWRIKLHPAMIDDAMAVAKAARTAKLLEEASKKPLGDDDLTPAQPTPVPQPMDPNHDYLDDPEKNPE